MVAQRGSNWRLAPSLIAMVAEANKIAPSRSKRSDGSIGDAKHSARYSDHNPDGGWVDAVDITHDPRGGFDAHAKARDIARRNDNRIKYIISNGQIHNRSRGDQPGAWRNYTGRNQHTQHAHFSIMNSGRSDARPWFIATPKAPVFNPSTQAEDDLMMLVKATGTNGIYATNGLTKTHVTTKRNVEIYQFLLASAGQPTNIGDVESGWLDAIPANK